MGSCQDTPLPTAGSTGTLVQLTRAAAAAEAAAAAAAAAAAGTKTEGPNRLPTNGEGAWHIPCLEPATGGT